MSYFSPDPEILMGKLLITLFHLSKKKINRALLKKRKQHCISHIMMMNAQTNKQTNKQTCKS